MNLIFVGFDIPDGPDGRNRCLTMLVQGEPAEIEALKKDLLTIRDSDDLVIALLQKKSPEDRIRLLSEAVAERLAGK